MKRQVFYSFHYDNDHWRASQVRNIGAIEGNRPAPDNDWETVKKGGDQAIERWINEQMKYRSCTIVLIGSKTADRKWIKHEIKKSWENGMGLVGIYIHNLKNSVGSQGYQGSNPFDSFNHNGTPLNQIIKTYNPPYNDSKQVYAYISNNIGAWADEAVLIRQKY
ncbi:MAG: TIR domain-containing protein [Candidatus Paceibacterota bacterium]|jgi:hypothetical protein